MFSFWKPNICKNHIRRILKVFLKKIKIPFLFTFLSLTFFKDGPITLTVTILLLTPMLYIVFQYKC